MADDEKAGKPDEAASAAKTSAASELPSPAPETSVSGETGASAKPTSPIWRASSDEWTASDSRGPLERAEGDTAAALEPSPSEPSSGSRTDDPQASGTPEAETAVAAPTAEPSPASWEPASTEPAAAPRWPIAAALLIGAVVGAGSAALVYRSAGGSGPDAEVAALASRVDALEKRPDPRAALADLSGKVAALQQKPAVPAATGGSDNSAKIAELQASLDELKARAGSGNALDAKVAALEGAVAGMKSATATTQAGVANVEGQQKTLSDKVMVPALAVVADSLVQQIDRGEPYAAQVDALASLGADPAKVAVLRENAAKGVPSAKILAAKFEPLAEPIAASSRKAAPNAGIVDRLKSGMLSMVSVRRADDTSGDDLPSRVARIRADLAHDDVAGALATWDALPPEAKARRGDAWAALAKTSADALTAARGLQHDAIVALGTKRS